VPSRSRRAGVALVAGVAGFWGCAVVAASLQPGYDAGVDYLSALAAVGARQPAWGLAMFACGAVALGAAAAMLLSRGFRTAPALLGIAAVAVVLAGAARVDCPDGAAGCAAGPASLSGGLASQVHSAAVLTSQLLLSAALLALAWQGRQTCSRTCVGLAGAGAVLTAVLSVNPLPLEPGWSQRLWVASGHAVLLAVWGACRPTLGIGSGPPSVHRRGGLDGDR
jgi:hypothetical protein